MMDSVYEGDKVPRILTGIIAVGTLLVTLSFTAWATNGYTTGSLTPGNWLTITGMLAGLVSTASIISFWLSTLASRIKAVSELLLRLEGAFREHKGDDAQAFSAVNSTLVEISKTLVALSLDGRAGKGD